MTAAKIADLKNRLSSYLNEVRNGGEVTVLNRDTPIAKIIPLPRRGDDFVCLPPRGSVRELMKIRPPKLSKKIDFNKVLKILREDRESR